jgi:hypothetical protein
VAREEKSGILYVHIYLPATVLHQLAGFPPAPQFLLIPCSQVGPIKREMACREEEGMQNGKTPPDPQRRMAPFFTLYETKPPWDLRSFRTM